MQHDPALAEQLLSEMDWVRALAARLVRDAGEAEDLAQEAWISALRSPPRRGTNLRGWLGTIVRSTAADFRRSHRRRRWMESLEEGVEPVETAHAADELVERAQIQRDLVDHVLALPKPQRTLLLERWFEGRSLRQIGDRLGISERQAKRRVDEAQAALRERLDRAWGGRASWCLAFLPWTRSRARSRLLRSGAMAVAGLLLLGAGALVARRVSNSGPEPAPTRVGAGAELASTARAGGTTGPDLLATEEGSGRVPVSETGVYRTSLTPATPIRATPVSGRIVALDGQPLQGLEVLALPAVPRPSSSFRTDRGWPLVEARRAAFGPVITVGAADPRSDRVSAVTAADGSFALAVEGPERVLELADPARVLTGSGWREGVLECVYVAVAARDIRGRVTDAHGVAIADASVTSAARLTSMRECRVVLEGGSMGREWVAVTDAAGRFELSSMAAACDQLLSVRAQGFESRYIALPGPGERELTVVLERADPSTVLEVRGTALDRSGAPVPRTKVVAGARSADADRAGRFALTLDRKQAAVSFAVLAPDRQTRVTVESIADLEKLLVAGVEVALSVGEPGFVFAGSVLDEAGRPLEGVRVDVADPGPEHRFERQREHSSSASGVTDALGRFSIEGLPAQARRLRCVHARSGWTWTSTELRPSPVGDVREIALTIAVPPTFRVVRGRVLDAADRPLAGVAVRLVEAGRDGPMLDVFALSDARGEFEVRDVAASGLSFVFHSAVVMRTEVRVPEDAGSEPVVVRIQKTRARFRVRVFEDDPATAFEVRDERNRPLMLVSFAADAEVLPERIERDAHGFPICAVTAGRHDVVLLRGHEELRRASVDFGSDSLEVIDFERPR